VVTTASEMPVPLILIPNFSIDEQGHGLSPLNALELSCNQIEQLQRDNKLPSPVCIVADAAFGNLETAQRRLPGIRFIMSSKETDYKLLVGHNLGPRESRTVCRGAVTQVVFNDVAQIYSISTFFTPSVPTPSAPAVEPVLTPESVAVLRELPDDQVRALAGMAGLPTSGTKEQLLRRLSHADYTELPAKKKRTDTPGSVAAAAAPAPSSESACRQHDEAALARRTSEFEAMTKQQLVQLIKNTLGAKATGNKADLIRRVLDHEGDSVRAVFGRLAAFLADKARGRPPQIDLYKRLFNLVDRLDVLLSYIQFPWVLKDFSTVFFVWLVRVSMVATYSALCDYKWDYVDTRTEDNSRKEHITTFARSLANELLQEEISQME